jgi:hypothetical protein
MVRYDRAVLLGNGLHVQPLFFSVTDWRIECFAGFCLYVIISSVFAVLA